jgi:hypothetical protein
MRRPRRLHAVKFDKDGALLQAGLIDVRRYSTRQETPACGGDRRSGPLGVSR